MSVIAVTERLLLRTLSEKDKDHILRISMQSPMMASLNNNAIFAETIREVCWQEETAPNIFPVLLFLKDSDTLVGRVCMQKTNTPIPEIGIDIHADHTNKGFGPEAIIAFCNWYAEAFRIKKVSVRISCENSHSIHVFEKIGAVYHKSATYLPLGTISVMQQKLPDGDFSTLLQESVREYILELPIKRALL